MASIFKRNGRGSYVIQYYDHTGRRREKSSRTTDKRAAERLAAQLERDVMLRREGLIPSDPNPAAQNLTPLVTHIENYLAD